MTDEELLKHARRALQAFADTRHVENMPKGRDYTMDLLIGSDDVWEAREVYDLLVERVGEGPDRHGRVGLSGDA